MTTTTAKVNTPDVRIGHVITIAGQIGRVIDIIEARGTTGRRHLIVEHHAEGERYESRYSVAARESFLIH